MAKNNRAVRPGYRCAECGHEVAKWVGRCPECQAWGAIEQIGPAARPAPGRIVAGAPSAPARPIGEVDVESARARPTGMEELDRVLGGGLVPGAVVLLAGEPGVGKSTLLLEVAHRWASQSGDDDGDGAGPATNHRALYVTGEESVGQVRLRAERTATVHDSLYLAAESDLAAVLGHVDAVRPGLLIVDSVQTMSSTEVDGSAGGVTQVRAVTSALVALAKERDLPVVLVGHVTKDGSVAGPRLLEHLVDVVLQFEGTAILADNVEIVVEDGADLTVVSLQDWSDDAVHLSTQHARVGRDATFKHVAISFGGDVVRRAGPRPPHPAPPRRLTVPPGAAPGRARPRSPGLVTGPVHAGPVTRVRAARRGCRRRAPAP